MKSIQAMKVGTGASTHAIHPKTKELEVGFTSNER